MAKLSVELNRYFFEEERQAKVTLAEILTLAGERTFGFLFVLISIPSALPVPATGYSIPFAIVIFFLAVQLIIRRQSPWLPAKIMNSSIKLETAQGFIKAAIPWLEKIEALTKPRLISLCTSVPGQIFIGSAIALMSISMMIPIPGTNTLPAIGIFVTGFGLVEDDGVISLVGLVICALGAALSISILLALVWGGSSLLDIIKGKLAL